MKRPAGRTVHTRTLVCNRDHFGMGCGCGRVGGVVGVVVVLGICCGGCPVEGRKGASERV